MTTKKAKKPVSFRLTEDTIAALKAYSETNGEPQAVIVEKALKAFIQGEKPASQAELDKLQTETKAAITLLNERITNSLESTKHELIEAIQKQPIQVAELPAPESKEKRRLTMRERLTGYVDNVK